MDAKIHQLFLSVGLKAGPSQNLAGLRSLARQRISLLVAPDWTEEKNGTPDQIRGDD
jgi:hypothetical protein